MKYASLTLLLILTLAGAAKANPTGYFWVVENTVNTENSSIIRVYNSRHELVYTERVEGRTLNITDKRVAARLNRKVKKLRLLGGKI